ncbi:type II secretion system minor pseudopilin GspK [Halomonas shantousis]
MSRQRGVALLMVLLCLALVGMVLASLAEDGRNDIHRLGLLQAETQARFHIQGAEIIARRALTDAAVRQASLWWQSLAGKPLDYPTDEGRIRLVVRDMRTCFNLNALAGSQAALASEQLARLLADRPPSALGGLTPTAFVARLADWIDADTQPRENGLDGVDYARGSPPRVSADTLLADLSELNWLEPLDTARFQTLQDLCVLPDTGAWRLNLNSVQLAQLPLLEALFEGQVARGDLIRLINARPAIGYSGIDAVRAQLGGDSEWLDRYGDRLTLTPDYVELAISVEVGGYRFNARRLLKAEGVSSWSPYAPASQVRILSRSDDLSAWMMPPTSSPQGSAP